MSSLPAYADPATVIDETVGQSSLRRFLHGLPGVDEVGADQRAAGLRTRSLKAASKSAAIDLAISMLDLTTLNGTDTPGKVHALAAKGIDPDPEDPTCPRVAALCVYPDMAAHAVAAVAGTGIKVASVAAAFPSGRAGLDVKLADTADAVAAGSDEVDMVIDRGALLRGNYLGVYEQIVAVRERCQDGPHGPARLKVILETGELGTYQNVRRASWLAMLAGADFIKTSTGTSTPAATLPVTVIMLEAVRDFRRVSGRQVGVKPAGGIGTTRDALAYLVAVNEILGEDWLTPDFFRFGASALLDDLLLQRRRIRTGTYAGRNYLTVA